MNHHTARRLNFIGDFLVVPDVTYIPASVTQPVTIISFFSSNLLEQNLSYKMANFQSFR
jgi:hypothetical protein